MFVRPLRGRMCFRCVTVGSRPRLFIFRPFGTIRLAENTAFSLPSGFTYQRFDDMKTFPDFTKIAFENAPAQGELRRVVRPVQGGDGQIRRGVGLHDPRANRAATALHRRRSRELRASRHDARDRPVRARPVRLDVCHQAVDGAPVRRLFHRRGVATPSIAATSPPVSRVCPWPSICRRIAVTTPIIRARLPTWAKRVWRWIRLPT